MRNLTKQLQGSKESTKQSKRVVQESNKRTKRTSNSDTNDTDSAYSTGSESNYTIQPEDTYVQPVQDHTQYITRPSTCSQSITILEDEITSTPTRTCPAPLPRPSKSQQITNTKCIQGTRPLHTPIPKHTKSSKTSYLSTLTHLQKPSTST